MTTKETLKSVPSGMLARLVSGDWPSESDGTFFIDRSPVCFDYILEYLRTGYVEIVPYDLQSRFARDARFYLLDDLAQEIERMQYRPSPYELYSLLPGKNLSGLDLNGMRLRKMDLSGIDFAGSSLIGTDLSEANLSGADFMGADLTNTDFGGAALRGANFRDAILNGTTFDRSSVNYATRFTAQSLRNASIKNVNGWDELIFD